MSQVAGDFYDFLVVDDRRLGVLIADVSGHGVPAALVASMVKVAIAAQAEHADDPAKVMAGLNSVLSGKLQGQFVTAAYLFLDPQAGTGRYSAAGHPPLLHYHAVDQSIHDVVENGLILGVMPFASYETRPLTLGSGDRFLLYTDGVLEADQRGEEFGDLRVKRVLAQPLSAEEHLPVAQLGSQRRGHRASQVTTSPSLRSRSPEERRTCRNGPRSCAVACKILSMHGNAAKVALVTGITGQDGAYLAEFLLNRGFTVFGTFRRTSSVNFWRIASLGIFEHSRMSLGRT